MDTEENNLAKMFNLNLELIQIELLLFILPQVAWSEEAEDIQQEVNCWLIAHRAEYNPERGPLIAWAKTRARFEILHWRDRQRRSRECISTELAESVGETLAAPEPETEDLRLQALEECCATLPPAQRQLIEDHHARGVNLATLASRLNRSPASVANSLYSIRATLRLCIEGKIKRHEIANS